MRKCIVFDLDGTLCEQTPSGGDYSFAKPKTKTIAILNALRKEGHHIIIFTARGMNTYNNDKNLIEANLGDMTRKWLNINHVYYNKLIFGKPSGDYYVDDKMITLTDLILLEADV